MFLFTLRSLASQIADGKLKISAARATNAAVGMHDPTLQDSAGRRAVRTQLFRQTLAKVWWALVRFLRPMQPDDDSSSSRQQPDGPPL
jgi:hypothetical protein